MRIYILPGTVSPRTFRIPQSLATILENSFDSSEIELHISHTNAVLTVFLNACLINLMRKVSVRFDYSRSECSGTLDIVNSFSSILSGKTCCSITLDELNVISHIRTTDL